MSGLVLLFISSTLRAQSRWAALGTDGKLKYGHFQTGDRIPDFSAAGYRGGGVSLPAVPVKRTVVLSGQDDTSAIQNALDEVAKMPAVQGIKGAVVLGPGTFHCGRTLSLASGVVLRGAGRDEKGTTLMMTGSPHLALRIAGRMNLQTVGTESNITDEYVPSGASSFHVNDASAFHPGDILLISKPITPAWVHFMGMDALGVRNGKTEHWISGRLDVRRRVSRIDGNTISLEVPLMDSYNSQYLGSGTVRVVKVNVTGQVSEVGVEKLRIVAPSRAITLGEPEFDGLKMEDAVNSWLSEVSFQETTSSVAIDEGTERVTVVNVDVTNHVPVQGAAKPFDFQANGQQILFDRCTGAGDNTFYFATQAKQQGPVVVLHCRFAGNGHIQPHQRWSTGLLIDNCEVPDGGIDLMNRGMMGSGHGWAIGWSVIWNSTAKSLAVHQPPGAENWSIGNRGEEIDPRQPAFDASRAVELRQGIVDSPETPVKPASLYLQQLLERLGPQAILNIGYK